MRVRILRLTTLLCAAIACSLAALPTALSAADAAPSLAVLDADRFPLPEPLRPNVAFWTDVFSRYHDYESILHDEDHPERIYTVLDFSALAKLEISDAAKEIRRRKAINKAKAKYQEILLALAAGKQPKHEKEALWVVELLAAEPKGRAKYRKAAHRLRSQKGLREVFQAAIERSGRYLGGMEKVFTDRGLPWELTRLPFVESMFQIGATSKVAAGGMWQMMPSTGRRWLDIGPEVDERYDPILAAEAAAAYLKENYQLLHTWPLAITAYNYGTGGLKRAVSRLGTRDFGVIIERHSGRTFGFASKNFYAEFLAAAQVYENRDHYFPGIRPNSPVAYEQFAADHYLPIKELAQGAQTALDDLRQLNPALTPAVWQGTLWLPRGYPLRVPVGQLALFEQSYEELPAEAKSDRQAGMRYRVRKGDTLGRIAARYGSTVSAIRAANKLRSAHYLRIGQVLWLPPGRTSRRRTTSATRSRVAQSTPSSTRTRATVHVVRSGDTLTAIAARYGISIAAIKAANRLRSAHRIFPGQRLSIPAG